MHNPESSLRFIEWGRLRGTPVSLTTTGTPLDTLPRFLSLPHNGLMISLHAGSAFTHRRLVPRGPEWDDFWCCMTAEWPRLSHRARRRVGINYLLLEGINTEEEELTALAERLSSLPEITLHLLVWNWIPDRKFSSPVPEKVDDLHRLLASRGLNVRRSNRWRQRKEGGCGTLFLKKEGS